MASVCGVLGLNFVFTCVALIALFHQDWFQCRKWGSTDVSNVVVIVDNYEAETIFLVTGYQYISAATIYNFGYDFRAAWIKNYILVLLVLGYTIIHVYITLVPSKLSCFFRINCTNPVSRCLLVLVLLLVVLLLRMLTIWSFLFKECCTRNHIKRADAHSKPIQHNCYAIALQMDFDCNNGIQHRSRHSLRLLFREWDACKATEKVDYRKKSYPLSCIA